MTLILMNAMHVMLMMPVRWTMYSVPTILRFHVRQSMLNVVSQVLLQVVASSQAVHHRIAQQRALSQVIVRRHPHLRPLLIHLRVVLVRVQREVQAHHHLIDHLVVQAILLLTVHLIALLEAQVAFLQTARVIPQVDHLVLHLRTAQVIHHLEDLVILPVILQVLDHLTVLVTLLPIVLR